MNTKIYVATHKPIEKYGDDCYQLIHVGAAQHPKSPILGAISDNDAVDNISDKNDKYCELTGLYHIWKNIKDADITGLVHYRRFFVKEDKLTKNPDEIILSQNEIEKVLNSYDIILGTPAEKRFAVGGYFVNPLDVPEFAIYRNILPSIKKLYPDYINDYYKEFLCRKMSFCNMMICKKTLFDEYCTFLFDILFDAEERWTDCGIGVAPREMGYISEYLLNSWVRHKMLKICYAPISLFEDTNKLSFKVHYILQSLGLKCLNPFADHLYGKFIKK